MMGLILWLWSAPPRCTSIDFSSTSAGLAQEGGLSPRADARDADKRPLETVSVRSSSFLTPPHVSMAGKSKDGSLEGL